MSKQVTASLLLLFIILFFGGRYLFEGSMNTYPSHLHAWTQSDRLAIAQNFQENGFDFFHPTTYNLLTKDGITQVDFPIHDYLVSIISYTLNASVVSTFRWYNLCLSMLGFGFLFMACQSLLKHSLKSLFITVFVATLPFYVYYQNGFLPSSSALSLLFISLFFLIQGLQKEKFSHFLLSGFFIGLSALCRSPFIFHLCIFILIIFYKYWGQKKKMIQYLSPYLIMLIAFFLYYFYNRSLAEQYGTMFLQKFLYISSFKLLKEILVLALDRWSNQLLSPFHAVIVITLFISLFYKVKTSKHFSIWFKLLGLLLISSTLSGLLFFFLMGRQFIDHDYYYISVIIPPLVYLLLLGGKFITVPRSWYTPVMTVLGIFFFYFFSQAKQVQIDRYTPDWDDRIHYAYEVYKNANDDLKKWGIKDTDTLIILEANSTNIPFTLWQKRGYVSLNSSEAMVDSVLNSRKQYVVMVDSFFRLDAFRDYPHLIDRLNLAYANGELSLYEDKPHDTNPKEFFEHYHFTAHLNFDEVMYNSNQFSGLAIHETTEKGRVLDITPKTTYSLTYQDTLSVAEFNKGIKISCVADYLAEDTIKGMQLICQYGNYYFAHYLQNSLKASSDWQHFQFQFSIPPEELKETSEIKIYYWNPNQDKVYIDDYHLIIYQ